MRPALLTAPVLLLCVAAAHADPNAEALYHSLNSQLKAARSLTGAVEIREIDHVNQKESKQVYTFRFLKPNYLQMVSKKYALYGDGRTLWTYYPSQKLSTSQPAQAEGMGVSSLVGFEAFTRTEAPPYQPGDLTVRTFEDAPCNAIPLQMEGLPPAVEFTLYLNLQTSLPSGWQMKDRFQTTVVVYRDVRIDDPLTPEQFAWRPPEPGVNVGMEAPRFTLKTPDGRAFSLADALPGHRAVLVTFWAFG